MTTYAGTLGPALGGLPPEIMNIIFELVLQDDRAAVILPRPMVAMEDEVIVTSSHPLCCVNREARAIYNSLFKAKALDMDVDHITAIVEDFNFAYFFKNFVCQVRIHPTENSSNPALTEKDPYVMFVQWAFTVRLTFTKNFLADPNDENINRWLEQDNRNIHIFDDTKRNFRFRYEMDAFPDKYLDGLQELLNDLVQVRGGRPGGELVRLMKDLEQIFMNRMLSPDDLE